MNIRTAIITLLIFPAFCFAELPPESAELVEKLEKWELEQHIAFQRQLADKRAQVVVALKSQLDARTRSGDLDGALAIKTEIERLSIESSHPLTERPERKIRDTPLQTFLIGTKWVPTEGGKSIAFTESNSGNFVSSSGEERTVKYIVKDSDEIALYWSAKPNNCVFNAERTFFVEVSAADATKKVKWTIVGEPKSE
ncbi:MAG: hypothetical protein ACI8UO_004858 [Verrucomicrobiales bacterium]|jgi:hypothetical protein